jgi:transposase
MMGRQRRDQGKLFYEFRLDDRIARNHLLRRIDVFVTAALADLHKELDPYYSDIGRPSIDPELMIRMLIVGYCYGIRSERRLTQEVALHLAYRWFCKLDLEDEIPHHSTFSLNRLGRFRESDVLRHVFERVVWAAMAMGLVKGEGFAVDASVLEANASRYHGKAPQELDWSEKQRQTRAVAEYLAALDEAAEPSPDRKLPKVISPSDPCSAWTAKANKRVQFGVRFARKLQLAPNVVRRIRKLREGGMTVPEIMRHMQLSKDECVSCAALGLQRVPRFHRHGS